MTSIKVLDSGCTKCIKTAELIEQVIQQNDIEASVTKVTDAEAIMGYGVMSTPAVVIDETVVHSGSMPNESEIMAWFKA